MKEYQELRTAVRCRSGICTAFDVRHELKAYLSQFRVKAPNGIAWNDLYTREEYHALVNRRKKRKPKRKKGEADPVLFSYDSIEGGRIELRGHHVELDEEHVADLDWIDALARRHELELEQNGYHAEF